MLWLTSNMWPRFLPKCYFNFFQAHTQSTHLLLESPFLAASQRQLNSPLRLRAPRALQVSALAVTRKQNERAMAAGIH